MEDMPCSCEVRTPAACRATTHDPTQKLDMNRLRTPTHPPMSISKPAGCEFALPPRTIIETEQLYRAPTGPNPFHYGLGAVAELWGGARTSLGRNRTATMMQTWKGVGPPKVSCNVVQKASALPTTERPG